MHAQWRICSSARDARDIHDRYTDYTRGMARRGVTASRRDQGEMASGMQLTAPDPCGCGPRSRSLVVAPIGAAITTARAMHQAYFSGLPLHFVAVPRNPRLLLSYHASMTNERPRSCRNQIPASPPAKRPPSRLALVVALGRRRLCITAALALPSAAAPTLGTAPTAAGPAAAALDALATFALRHTAALSRR